MKKNNLKKKKWYEYLWIASSAYLILGAFNILFAWLGLICFLVPLIISISGGGKAYCNTYCGRGQLLSLLGNKLKLSRNKSIPKWMKTKYFRYGFLTFFLAMFLSMIFNTYLVFQGVNSLNEVITILWTFKLPWNFNDLTNITPWIAQFSFGFYSIMLTSTILGVITMVLFKPNSWCVYCPMGTMTQGISILKNNISSKS
ncbi:4Fe-4S binding protein [Clostridium taeniosporum]|uniref:4Fe-4S binding protein n=1 Tax=Clostridium taeniosporum TaxID=394958 RepID=A0A1D7XK11_9CLOT|nr:4Fe-4S binding protein [Clostridium taeniosporum]AOR23656.1 4Fe-4S binding protein [Clostridium taeniosporum]